MAKSPFSLEGKTAIVTGGGTGIGKSIAIEFARAGADVALCSRKLEHLEPVAKEITNLGRRTFAMPVDVRQEDQVKGIVDRAVSEWGRLDVMVNNAAPRSAPSPRTSRSTAGTPSSASTSTACSLAVSLPASK